jgi:hypothetical protein
MKRLVIILAALAALFLTISPSGFFDGPRGDSAEAAITKPAKVRTLTFDKSWVPRLIQVTAITLTDQTWTCNKALSLYGPLPIQVTINYTAPNLVEFGAFLGGGCLGTGNSGSPQLILNINGDGVKGVFGDLIRIANTANVGNMVIGGSGDCGIPRQGNHQDGIQAIGGHDITFLDFEQGQNGTDGMPSCQGAGGGIFYSSAQNIPVNMQILGGHYKACNTGIREGANGQTGQVGPNVEIKSGYDPAHPTACRDSAGDPLNAGAACLMDNEGVVDVQPYVCDKWPWEDTPPPDITPPPDPTIDSGPSGTVYVSTATFTFSDSEVGVNFSCSLDGAVFSSCISPKSYSEITIGQHTFSVKAADQAGNESEVASRTWTRAPCSGIGC